MHSTRKNPLAGRRTIVLAFESELARDGWFSAIDYLKTKAIFDSYQKRNTLVNFIGHEKNEEHHHKNDNED